jgi:CRISPR-associated endonuclease/helicase Cas3
VDLGKKQSAPYDESELKDARDRVCRLRDSDASIAHLEELGPLLRNAPVHVIRRHDLHGLFSTEPDLAGGFTDVSRFVRDLDQEAEVYVFWRDFEGAPGDDQPPASRSELCHVAMGQMKEFLGKKGSAWEWDGEVEDWLARRANDVQPGMTLMLSVTQGGYARELGWTGRASDKPEVIPASPEKADGLGRDRQSETDWLPLAAHLSDAEAVVGALANSLGWGNLPRQALTKAALWHDVGKLHSRWQGSVETYVERVRGKIAGYLAASPNGPEVHFLQSLLRRCAPPATAAKPWAKFPDVQKVILSSGLDNDTQGRLAKALKARFRPGLRHEAASALAAWQQWQGRADGWTALGVYLVAAHHGKVRAVLRSRLKRGDDVFGVRPGDKLPLLPGWLFEERELDLTCRVFGAMTEWDSTEDTVVLGQPSWVSVVAELLGPEFPTDRPSSLLPEGEPRGLGPFRLAFLEALISIADVRASRQPGLGANLCQKS